MGVCSQREDSAWQACRGHQQSVNVRLFRLPNARRAEIDTVSSRTLGFAISNFQKRSASVNRRFAVPLCVHLCFYCFGNSYAVDWCGPCDPFFSGGLDIVLFLKLIGMFVEISLPCLFSYLVVFVRFAARVF